VKHALELREFHPCAAVIGRRHPVEPADEIPNRFLLALRRRRQRQLEAVIVLPARIRHQLAIAAAGFARHRQPIDRAHAVTQYQIRVSRGARRTAE
jgi:hypothetical protein